MFYVPAPVFDDTTDNTEYDERASHLSSPSSVQYEGEWNLLTSEKSNLFLKKYVCDGNLRSSSIRSVYWRVLLDIFPVSSPSEWLNVVRRSRKTYNETKNEFTFDPRVSSSLPDDNPLSQDENSTWYKYFCDNELKRVIKQDVVRTSPEKAFFQLSNIQEIMTNVLFYYARQNPKLCYRQGMHEILAPLVLVINEDYEAFEEAQHKSVINPFISEIMDSTYLESDVFHLFSVVMCHMAKFYDVGYVPTASGHFPCQDFSTENNDLSNRETESSICSHLNDLKDNILLSCDRQLYDHLTKLSIPFTTFGIKWVRLLYGREFPFRELLILWDTIFAIQSDFDLVDYILIAMLVAIRDKLLNSDFVECLNCLMKYPSTVDIKFVINYALYLYDPTCYLKPSTLHLKVVSNDQAPQNRNDTTCVGKPNHSKSNSNKHSSIVKKFKNLKMNPKKKNSKDDDFNLVDDYSSKTFEVVVTELKHMRVVMSLCKLKLFQYHEILSASVSSQDTGAQQALTGIQELCTLLDIDHFSLKSSDNKSAEIETGSEAREVRFVYPQCGTDSGSGTSSDTFLRPSIDAVALYLPPPNSDIDMKIFKRTECETTDFSKFPIQDPLKLNKAD